MFDVTPRRATPTPCEVGAEAACTGRRRRSDAWEEIDVVGGNLQHTTLRCFHSSAVDIVEMIGVGKSAITVKARMPKYGLVAIKCIPTERLSETEGTVGSRDSSFRLPLEVLIHSLLDHPRIPRLIGVCIETSEVLLIQELVSGAEPSALPSDLWTLVYSKGRDLGPRRVLGIARDVAMALEHVHSHGICHCDVNPKNILVTSDYRAKLTDFGCAKKHHHPSLAATSDGRSPHQSGRLKGCTIYLAPEATSADEVSAKSDIYSFGVVLVELLIRKRPWGDAPDCEIEYQTQVEGRSALDRHWAEVEGACRGERGLQSGFATLIQAMLSFGPGDRPTAAEVRIGIESAAREAL